MVANEKLLIRQTKNRNSKQKVNNSIDEFCIFSLCCDAIIQGLVYDFSDFRGRLFYEFLAENIFYGILLS